MALYENYENSTLGQRMFAVGGCVIGGGIVLFLGVMGAFGDYDSLVRMGFSGWTIPFYLVVLVCGFLILMRVRYAAVAAAVASLLEIVLYICVQLSTTPDVGFLILLKGVVILAAVQLCVAIETFEEDDDMPMEQVPQPRRQPMMQAPQGRRVVNRQAPVPRNQAPVGRNEPPRPRR